MRLKFFGYGYLSLVCWLLLPPQLVFSEDSNQVVLKPATAKYLFIQKVRPLFIQKCGGCHGDNPKDREANLNLSSRELMLKGGDSKKPALIPGQPLKSPLFQSLDWKNEALQMPPKERNRLTADEISLVKQWILAGAPWPNDQETKIIQQQIAKEQSKNVTVPTTAGLAAAWNSRKYKLEDIWAYQPITQPVVPSENLDASRIFNPIDAFIQQKMLRHQIMPAKPANRTTLLRRLRYNLTGLPPSTEELNQFLKMTSQNTYTQYVEQLLSSEQYGEKMAQHWLDVVRYADTAGFSNDFERPNAWRYRDYVVRSFNSDKPYNQFVTEQLAGDELDEQNPENLIAVGFLRMGPWEQTGMSVAAVTRQQFLDDVTHSVGVTFLAQGLRCCKCHDHKFDPLPTRDYYRMQAVFSPVQFADREVPYLSVENIRNFKKAKLRTEEKLERAKKFLSSLNAKKKQRVAAYLAKRGVKTINELPLEERKGYLGLTDLEKSLNKIFRKRQSYFQREQKRYQPYAFSLYNGPTNGYVSTKSLFKIPPLKKRSGVPETISILSGGSLAAPLEKVTPGVLSAVADSNDKIKRTSFNSIPKTTNGRRLALAQWMTHPKNTLTARVIVNRVWQWNFGAGLVETSNNFGIMGARPSHPKLLDWLAVWFMQHDWSIKQLQKLIVTSYTFQQSGQHRDYQKIDQFDPNNQLLAYFPSRRLTAEELRDSLLAASEELNFEMGGLPVFPEINWEVAMQPRHIMGSVAPAYQPSPTRAARHRRTLYAYRCRTLRDPMLEVFNKPGSDISCARREETTVSPQVFALFNSQFAQARSLAIAARIGNQHQQPIAQIRHAFKLMFLRIPSQQELDDSLTHLREMTKFHQTHTPVKKTLPTSIKREMVEELTGKTFFWDEELEVMQDYQADLTSRDVDAPTRALAELCLVLMNSNEFVYIR